MSKVTSRAGSGSGSPKCVVGQMAHFQSFFVGCGPGHYLLATKKSARKASPSSKKKSYQIVLECRFVICNSIMMIVEVPCRMKTLGITT